MDHTLKDRTIDRHLAVRLDRTAQVLRSASKHAKNEAVAKRLNGAADALMLLLNGEETSRDVLKEIERIADSRFCHEISTLIAHYGERAKDDPALTGVVETLSLVFAEALKNAPLTDAQTDGE